MKIFLTCLVGLAIGILFERSFTLFADGTGGCPMGNCSITADSPTYTSGGCSFKFNAYYGGNATFITGTQYAGCPNYGSGGMQAFLFRGYDDALIASGGSHFTARCNLVDCGGNDFATGFHRVNQCVCACRTSYYTRFNASWYSAARPNCTITILDEASDLSFTSITNSCT